VLRKKTNNADYFPPQRMYSSVNNAMKNFLWFLIFFLVTGPGFAQIPDSSKMVITDKGDRIEVQSGDTVFEVTYEFMYYEYLKKGVDKANNAEYEAAVSFFNTALLYITNEPQAYYNRGLAYFNMKRTEDAIADFSKAILLDNNFEEAYSQRGIALSQLDRPEEALPDFEMAVRINPGSGKAQYNLGIIYLQLGLEEDACNKLRKALELGYSRASDIIESYCQ
jgi:tetratricopeptide (TPR) repeat protein